MAVLRLRGKEYEAVKASQKERANKAARELIEANKAKKAEEAKKKPGRKPAEK